MSLYQRRKGHRGETEVADLLRPLFAEIRTRRAGGESAADTRGSDLCNCAPYNIQVKLRNRLNVEAAWKEAGANANGAVPLLVFRRDRGPWLVTMSLAEWMKLERIRQAIGVAEIVRGNAADPEFDPAAFYLKLRHAPVLESDKGPARGQ
jgi:hypothetical protein